MTEDTNTKQGIGRGKLAIVTFFAFIFCGNTLLAIHDGVGIAVMAMAPIAGVLVLAFPSVTASLLRTGERVTG